MTKTSRTNQILASGVSPRAKQNRGFNLVKQLGVKSEQGTESNLSSVVCRLFSRAACERSLTRASKTKTSDVLAFSMYKGTMFRPNGFIKPASRTGAFLTGFGLNTPTNALFPKDFQMPKSTKTSRMVLQPSSSLFTQKHLISISTGMSPVVSGSASLKSYSHHRKVYRQCRLISFSTVSYNPINESLNPNVADKDKTDLDKTIQTVISDDLIPQETAQLNMETPESVDKPMFDYELLKQSAKAAFDEEESKYSDTLYHLKEAIPISKAKRKTDQALKTQDLSGSDSLIDPVTSESALYALDVLDELSKQPFVIETVESETLALKEGRADVKFIYRS